MTTPNILVIIIDDAGFSDVGFTQQPGSLPTPNMDAFVSDGGLMLNNFYTGIQCTPSRAQFLTGKYSHKIGMQDG